MQYCKRVRGFPAKLQKDLVGNAFNAASTFAGLACLSSLFSMTESSEYASLQQSKGGA